MALLTQLTDRDIIQRYTEQPEVLPRDLRARIEASWDGEPVQLYALADLDDELQLAHTWVTLGPSFVTMASERAGAEPVTIERSRIRELRTAPGMSCNVLLLLGPPDEPALALLRYTQRQRRGMENLIFVLEQALAGRDVETGEPDEEYVESLVAPIKEAQALHSSHHLAVIWRLMSYLRPYRGQVVLGMAAACLMTGLALIPPFLTGWLIDELVEPAQAGTLDRGEALRMAWWVLCVIGAAYVLRQACAFVRLRRMAVLGECVARDLRTELYDHLHTLSLAFFGRKKTGSLITRVSADTDRLWEFLALGIVDVSLSLVMLVGLGSVLIYLDWQLGLVMTVPVPLICWLIFRHGQRMNRMFLRAWRKWSLVTDVLSDTIPGMRVVKAFNQEEQEKRRFTERNYDAVSDFNRIHLVWTSFWPMLMLSVHAMIVGVWALALPRLLEPAGEAGALSAGVFVSFLLYTTMFVQPIEIVGQMARIMNRATSSAHRVFEVLDTEPQIRDRPEPVRLEPVKGHVRFRDVTFGYDGVRQVIRGMSFEVRPGEIIGLVGPSGGGKSTVVSLIARFYDVTGGGVEIDGVDLRELDRGHFRRQVGMVLQDPYLFHGTILENIRYGNPSASYDNVLVAARAANAHDFVCDLRHGYETLVGERGQTLSGGERQRISIARAILHDPRILILDEATSSVDTETEAKIQEALDRLVSGRTVFAIAHRLSTLRRADRLFVIEDGRITERGTHAELLELDDGTYRNLVQLQQQLHDAV
jgi:ATP-binding cassette subfamily B protein